MEQSRHITLERTRHAGGRGVRAFALVLALGLASQGVTAQGAAPPAPADRAALEQQLRDAQGRLDEAAREVAELSGQLHGRDPATMAMIKRHQGGAAGRGAMLGINIGGEQTKADGVEVMSVSPSGPAEAAGLRKGDVITAIDGKPLRKNGENNPSRQLVEHLRAMEPGQAVKLDYLRDGRKASTSVTTVAAEPPLMRMVREHWPKLEGMDLPIDVESFLGGPGGRGFRSLELVPITPKLGQYFGTDKGLLVVRAPAGDASKLEEGDVILTIGDRTPDGPRHAFRILGSYQPSETVKVELLRQRKRLTIEMQVPERGEGAARRDAPAQPRAPAPPTPPRSGTVSS